MKWRDYFARGQRRLPRTATFAERGALTKQLAAEWRAGGKSPLAQRNPGPDFGSSKLLKVGLIGAAIFVAMRALGQRQPVAPVQPPSP